MKPKPSRLLLLCQALLLAVGCQEDLPDPEVLPDFGSAPEAVPDDAIDLVDPDIPPALAGEDGWNFARVAEVDIDGDGTPERVVLTARVELFRGQPAWDDGQPWQIYIESDDGPRTYLYARRLQLGSLDLRITTPDDDGHRSILLIEHLPDQLAVYEAAREDGGTFSITRAFSRALDPTGETAGPRLH